MKFDPNHIFWKVLLHLIVWSGLFSLLLFAGPVNLSVLPNDIYYRIAGHLTLIVIFYYINTLLLIPQLLFRKKVWWYLLAVLTCFVLIYLINISFDEYFHIEKWKRPQPLAELDNRFLKEGQRPDPQHLFVVMSTILTFAFGLIFTAVSRALKQDKDKEEMEKEKLTAELAFLKNQINPHFFFNTLNNIYSFVGSNPDKARQTIHQLSKLMRYMLYETDKQTIPIGKEVAFLEDYIKLMKLRLAEDVAVDLKVDQLEDHLEVPPLIFIPFIENAFKHGVSYEQPSSLSISLTSDQSGIYFDISNSIHKKSNTGETGGIGLTNIRKRLELLYPKQNYRLDIQQKDSKFTVNLILPRDDKMYSHR